ncbi:MAG: hypothetical protein PHP44_01555 [Kiritimatiellae bacterium]|nr:hypothetical protein [Kiritimatiellia bacterium]MDD4734772.1 hypothetical protein [Kiritimatiellia bacterium]
MKPISLWKGPGEAGSVPTEEWIHAVMNRVRAEAETLPRYSVPRANPFGTPAGIAAAAALIFSLLGWFALPSDDELTWKTQTDGFVTEYLLLTRK